MKRLTLLADLPPAYIERYLFYVAGHEAGHAVHWLYAFRLGLFPAPFARVWAATSAAEYDEAIAGAGAVEAARDARFNLDSMSRADAVNEITNRLAGPMAEARLEIGGDWWAEEAFDNFINLTPDTDRFGARDDMNNAILLMRRFPDGGQILLDAFKEVQRLWNQSDVWNCVVHVTKELRKRGQLSFEEVEAEIA